MTDWSHYILFRRICEIQAGGLASMTGFLAPPFHLAARVRVDSLRPDNDRDHEPGGPTVLQLGRLGWPSQPNALTLWTTSRAWALVRLAALALWRRLPGRRAAAARVSGQVGEARGWQRRVPCGDRVLNKSGNGLWGRCEGSGFTFVVRSPSSNEGGRAGGKTGRNSGGRRGGRFGCSEQHCRLWTCNLASGSSPESLTHLMGCPYTALTMFV